ncbi:MAG: hypothetical protein JXB17_08860 [Bacteroidales bacterium]|nr:hypothetical protein [Bacteroidales bacterium]
MENKASKLTGEIQSAIKKAQKQQIYYEVIYENDNIPDYSNKLIFFMKPEIMLKEYPIKYKDIINLILNKIGEFNFSIKDIRVLSANYLKDYNIIAQHYGVINRIANDAKGQISDIAKEEFEKLYNIKIDDVNAYGGFEFLKRYPEFTPFTLNTLWKNKKNQKLSSGIYCEKLMVEFDTVYLLNGFHPFQIWHFTQKNRFIIVFTLTGNISWRAARENFIGDTDPNKAKEGSIRRELLLRKDDLGLPGLTQAKNGVHLSAGPIEALVELIRFSSDFSSPSKIRSFEEFKIGRLLKEHFNDEQIDKLINNINISVNTKVTSIFELTELLEPLDAIKKVKNLI